MAIPIGLAMAGVNILGKGLTSFLQGRRARRLERQNPFPEEKVNPLFQKNVALAEMDARTGMPQEQYNNRLNGIQRNQAGALSMFGRRGGSTGSLASIVRGGNDATADLVSDDARDRQQNKRFAFGQRINLAQEQNRVFDWNKRQKFLMNLAKSQAMRGASGQNLNGAFNDASQLAILAMGGNKDSETK